MRQALVADWLIDLGGAEKLLEEIYHLFPAPLYTLLFGGRAKQQWTDREVIPSFLQKIPFSTRIHRYLLPWYPKAIESFDLKEYDLILSSSFAVAKGILTHADQLHICYCSTPARYAWDLTHFYLAKLGIVGRMMASRTLHHLRLWDAASTPRVDHFIANSRCVARRIYKCYRREARVIYPPVDTNSFTLCTEKGDEYVALSRLVPYKRIDLLVAAFARMPRRRLTVIGEGPEHFENTTNVTFVGHLPQAQVVTHLQRARALLFAAEEDFGIVPVEAQACGTPVIAYGRGGALESVVEGKTGLFFSEQTAASVIEAIERFEKSSFDPHAIRSHAEQFSTARFAHEFSTFVHTQWEAFDARRHSRRR